jgi:hypothetical protein
MLRVAAAFTEPVDPTQHLGAQGARHRHLGQLRDDGPKLLSTCKVPLGQTRTLRLHIKMAAIRRSWDIAGAAQNPSPRPRSTDNASTRPVSAAGSSSESTARSEPRAAPSLSAAFMSMPHVRLPTLAEIDHASTSLTINSDDPQALGALCSGRARLQPLKFGLWRFILEPSPLAKAAPRFGRSFQARGRRR